MSPEHIYVYKACQIVIQSAKGRWAYVVLSDGEYYERYPPRNFDSEDDALNAAAAFCDYRMDNVIPIDEFHKRKEITLPV